MDMAGPHLPHSRGTAASSSTSLALSCTISFPLSLSHSLSRFLPLSFFLAFSHLLLLFRSRHFSLSFSLIFLFLYMFLLLCFLLSQLRPFPAPTAGEEGALCKKNIHVIRNSNAHISIITSQKRWWWQKKPLMVAKEPLIIEHICRKWPVIIRHPVFLTHTRSNVDHDISEEGMMSHVTSE